MPTYHKPIVRYCIASLHARAHACTCPHIANMHTHTHTRVRTDTRAHILFGHRAGETFVVCGGSDGAVIHNSCEMFVPTKKPATSARAGKKIAQPLNGATPFGAASVAAAGLFGAPAGLDSTTTFTPIRAGSTALGRWQMLPPMPTARTGCTACYVVR